MTGQPGAITRLGAAIATLAWWTIRDEYRSRSTGLLLAACAMLVVFARGCAQGTVVVNGAPLDGQTVLAHLTFHGIAAGILLVAALRGMRLFHRERDDGTHAYLLARPLARGHYVAGKIAGLWGAWAASMLVLHGVLGLSTIVQTPAILPGYLAASILCSLNLALVVAAVLALSLWLPDFLAFLAVLAVVGVSFIGHGIAAAAPLVQAGLPPSDTPPGVTWWHVAWVLWPKVGGLQMAAWSMIGGASLLAGTWVLPLLNVSVYGAFFVALCYLGFSREDVV
jgi:ABC-type transport system involved in multi-copper enzyme maturation permease subunit